MAKTKTGYVPPKGRPSGEGRESGIKEALAVTNPEDDEQIAAKYLEGPDEPAANVHVRHPNRNTDKGRDGDNLDA